MKRVLCRWTFVHSEKNKEFDIASVLYTSPFFLS